MVTNPYQPPVNALREPLYSPPGGEKLSFTQILFSFRGRIPRSTFWLYSILLAVVGIVAVSLIAPLLESPDTAESTKGIAGILVIALIIPFIWISLALRIKRWHDRDKSGAWILIGLVPLVGPIWSFVECCCLRGTFGDNNYGSDPT